MQRRTRHISTLPRVRARAQPTHPSLEHTATTCPPKRPSCRVMSDLEKRDFGNSQLPARSSTTNGSHTARSGAIAESPTSTVPPTIDDNHSHTGIIAGEKGKDGAYTGVYPKNSFDVYGDEASADSECRPNDARRQAPVMTMPLSPIQNDGLVESVRIDASRDGIAWCACSSLEQPPLVVHASSLV